MDRCGWQGRRGAFGRVPVRGLARRVRSSRRSAGSSRARLGGGHRPPEHRKLAGPFGRPASVTCRIGLGGLLQSEAFPVLGTKAALPFGSRMSRTDRSCRSAFTAAAVSASTARSAEASAIVTRVGRDRVSGLGSPKATRARAEGDPIPRRGRECPVALLCSSSSGGGGAGST